MLSQCVYYDPMILTESASILLNHLFGLLSFSGDGIYFNIQMLFPLSVVTLVSVPVLVLIVGRTLWRIADRLSDFRKSFSRCDVERGLVLLVLDRHVDGVHLHEDPDELPAAHRRSNVDRSVAILEEKEKIWSALKMFLNDELKGCLVKKVFRLCRPDIERLAKENISSKQCDQEKIAKCL